ncbi:hypothetical protein BDZ91DRAFT_730685 [Kalaharituber pfeilii]|nr:hypothetical protein BDZ91DRAFT_730685 [Kalaharituber pfeilii]
MPSAVPQSSSSSTAHAHGITTTNTLTISSPRNLISSTTADKILNLTGSSPYHPDQQPKFAFNDFLRKEYRFGLDPNRKVCTFFVQGHCPLDNACPDKHTASLTFNKAPSLVCKHWLRSLCKKGEQCEFLHEYNLRKMPECNFFVRNGYCSNGEECLYLHIDPESKIPLCPHYEKGFCPLGPNCSKKHVRKQICKYYLCGFCPEGARQCKEGAHPKWVENLPPPTLRKVKDAGIRAGMVVGKEEMDTGIEIGAEGFLEGEEGIANILVIIRLRNCCE